jgi:hypothetical protein
MMIMTRGSIRSMAAAAAAAAWSDDLHGCLLYCEKLSNVEQETFERDGMKVALYRV